MVLRRGNHEVVAVETLADALSLLETERFEALIVDLSLPDAHGVEAVQAISTAAANTPLLVFTGDTRPGILEKCLDAGADDVLYKPARLELVQHALLVGTRSKARTTARARLAVLAMVEVMRMQLHGG